MTSLNRRSPADHHDNRGWKYSLLVVVIRRGVYLRISELSGVCKELNLF